MKRIKLSQVIDGFNLELRSRRISEHTIADYDQAYKKLIGYLKANPDFETITTQDIKSFFAYLSTTPIESNGGVCKRAPRMLSNKTLLNIHTALCALWTWATDDQQQFTTRHVMRGIARPKPEPVLIDPFSDDDLRAMLQTCERKSTYHHFRANGQNDTAAHRPTSVRDKAIILLLLDTGLRATELCDLRLRDLDQKNNTLTVTCGKGRKPRIIPYSPRTAKGLWHYITLDRPNLAPDDIIFVTSAQTPMNRNGLFKLIAAIGKRAGVKNAYPHRFRHTFATLFLINGGDPFALQQLLGHSCLEMVSHYVAYVRANAHDIHRTASPVANLAW